MRGFETDARADEKQMTFFGLTKVLFLFQLVDTDAYTMTFIV